MKTYFITYKEGFTGEVKTLSIMGIDITSEEKAINYFKGAIVPCTRWGAEFISITN